MAKNLYSIIYVMPKGSRVGMYASMNEEEMVEQLKSLGRKGCSVEKVLIDDNSIRLTPLHMGA